MHDVLLQLSSWLTSHPYSAGFIIFLSSFAESLAFVGLIMPGSVLMLAAGALIADGALSFWPTMAWAVCGAVFADGLSFWLGHHFKERIHSFSLFRRFPKMLVRGEDFFRRHGGKSIFFGRFIGPVRPVIPLVAGMMGMARGRFSTYNILSAFIWAPAYLLPGMAFGASLTLAGEVAGRLALLLVILLVLLWLAFSLFRRIFLAFLAHWSTWEKKIATFVARYPFMQEWLGGLFDKQASLVRPLLVLSLVFICAGWLFFGITEDVMTGDPLVRAGQSLYHLLQGLRTPWGDAVMVAITMLGDAAVTVPLAMLVFFRLLVKKDRFSALLLTITILGAFGLVTLIKEITRIPRPVDLYGGAVHWAFPSSHATMSLVIYGFLALLSSRDLSPKRRWLPFALSLFLVLGIGFSRLYLGAHWLSDVVGGFSLGTAWLIIMTIIYLHGEQRTPGRGLFRFSLLGLILVAALHWTTGFGNSRFRYRQRHTQIRMTTEYWLQTGWRHLPMYRFDLGGEEEQPLNIQYDGRLSTLAQVLRHSGWHRPVPLTPATSLRWLMSSPRLDDLPVLPQFHDGRNEVLLLVHFLPGSESGNDFLALRLWPADVVVEGGAPLRVGTLTRMTVRHYLGLLNLPRTAGTASPELLGADLQSMKTIFRKFQCFQVLLVQEKEKNVP